ncbi:hypothetical protein [Candidatus Nitrosocosmicus sp. SS]|uniref:hypothetical protein n=1 Tax=Candidatus Nitrosocosmicus agrestis TaxID=2563600 RepID=UPI0012B653E0|nr:hypothetical protein [Candidatus Nitrosocosmicus sp. SS]MDR4491639.1 hypothetical protein [Candidatus Nitrosocosmicus sp.]
MVLVSFDTMEGILKLKCNVCGTMFMSETQQSKCPSCAEQSSNMGGHSGCGCGHSH